MEKMPVFVGLDYHKDSVQVGVLDSGGKVLGDRTCGNDPRQVAEYVATHGGVRSSISPTRPSRSLTCSSSPVSKCSTGNRNQNRDSYGAVLRRR